MTTNSNTLSAAAKQPGKLARPRRIPQRMCAVCRTTGDKRTLTRVVRTAENGVQVDPSGKLGGRGAYLCDQPTCWQRATDSDILGAALRTVLNEADRQRLRQAGPGGH